MVGKRGMRWKVSSRTNADVRRVKLDRQLAYRRWSGMMDRCYDEHAPGYDNYGGRGIHVDKRWHEFENYYADVGNPPQYGLTVDRPDNDKGYGPGNWRWATMREQADNRRPRALPHSGSLSFIYDDGKLLTTREAAELLGVRRDSLKHRLQRLRERGIFEMDLDSLRNP